MNHDTQEVYIDVYEAASQCGTALHTVAMLSKRWNNIPESDVLTFGTDEDHGLRFVVSLPETPAWDIPIRHGELHEEHAIATKAEEGLYWIPPSKLSQLSSAGVAYLEDGILGKYTFEWEIWDLHLQKDREQVRLRFQSPIELTPKMLLVTTGALHCFESRRPDLSVAHPKPGKFVKGAIFKARKKRLRQWLEEKCIPEDEWYELGKHDCSRESMYVALSPYPEFRKKKGLGDSISPNSFFRSFWKRQKLAGIS